MAELTCRVEISRGAAERNGWSFLLAAPTVGQAIGVSIEKTGERVTGIVESVGPGDGIYDYVIVANQVEPGG